MAEPSNSPFRKKAIERLSSPEQLDKLMKVVLPKAWIAIVCLAGLIVAALVWAFLGHIPIEVEGKGIILTPGGLYNIQAGTSGIVSEIYVRAGDLISPGQLLVKMEDTNLSLQVQQVEKKITQLLKEKGASREESIKLEKYLQEAREQLTLLKQKETALNIYAHVKGEIVEIDTAPGNFIQAGQLVGWIERPLQPDEHYLCLAYLPIGSGEKVLKGMQADIAPVNVSSEDFGYLEGVVQQVSEFPVSDIEMLQKVRNPQLVTFLKQGLPAVVATTISLTPDPNDPSGYKWTSAQGPFSKLRSGTVCNIKIIIASKRPISYLLPLDFKKEKGTLPKRSS